MQRNLLMIISVLPVMLIGLKGELVPGAEVGLSLTFDDGSRARVQAPVHEIGAIQPHH